MEEDLKQAQARVHQLERLVKEANESRNVVFRKFNALKKKHDQLSKFKLSIEHMLHGDVPYTANEESTLDNFDEDVNTSIELDNFKPKSFDVTSSDYNSIAHKEFDTSPQKISPTQFTSISSTNDFTSVYNATSNDDSNEAEAKSLYFQVKQTLSAQQFKQFANNIRQLNSGQQSVEETLQNIKEIFGSERQHLFIELQKLVKSNTQE